MAKFVEGDSQGMHRGASFGDVSRLPPRVPCMPGRGLPTSDVGMGTSTGFHSIHCQKQHARTPSCDLVIQEQPLWLDELLEDSGSTGQKGSHHRRSASDSFTYLDNNVGLYSLRDVTEDDNSDFRFYPAKVVRNTDGLKDAHLTDLLDEIQHLQAQRNLPVSSFNQLGISRCESSSANERRSGSYTSLPNNGPFVLKVDAPSFVAANMNGHENKTGNPMVLNGQADDQKKAKRQSAQRSRVRKLQYIAELEGIVNALQAQVSSLSPQLLFFKRQRALLDMDNTALKQKIAVCAREKSIKDAQNETLNDEVQRLQRVCEIQGLHHHTASQKDHKQQASRIHRHSSLPSDFGGQMPQQYGELIADFQQGEGDTASPSSVADLLQEFSCMSLDNQLKRQGL